VLGSWDNRTSQNPVKRKFNFVEDLSVLKNPFALTSGPGSGVKTSPLWRFGLVSGLLESADRADNHFFNTLTYSTHSGE
jgi:hypothetical protein